jgi:hypothetical protein
MRPSHVHRPADTHMRARCGIGHQADAIDAVAPHETAEGGGAGDEHRDEVGHGGAADHQPRRRQRQAQHFRCPPDHLPLARDRRVVAPAAIRIQAAGQQFGQHAHGRPAAMHPAVEARMPVADAVGREQLPVGAVNLLGRSAGPRQFLLPGGAHRIGHRLPHRAFADPFKIVEQIVQYPVPEGAQFRPVRRIK